MSAPVLTYHAKREKGAETYTLTLEFSDDPGSTLMLGMTKEQCEREINAAKSLGYQIQSAMRSPSAASVSA